MSVSGYCAVVAAITVRLHPNADNLLLGNVLGNQVVVGLDSKDGDIGVYFPTDGQLSAAFVLANKLYTKSAMDKLGFIYTADWKFGFFDERRRVRAQRFRGEKSDGFFVPLSYFNFTGVAETMKVGDTFTELGGHEICAKYYTPGQLRFMNAQKNKPRKELRTFPKHDVTRQFRFVADAIPEDSVVYITEKLHGTSGRYAHCLDYDEPTGLKATINAGLKRVGLKPYFEHTPAWRHLNGSKNVVLEKADSRNSFYGTDEFRYKLTENLVLHRGEVIYFEIVGWAHESRPIMEPHSVPKELKELKAQYGDIMIYDYGCPIGTCRMYVYKIAMLNEDGIAIELSWPQLVQRCGELGLAHVPLLAGPIIHDGVNDFHQKLRSTVEYLTDGPSMLDSGHMLEGVVIRTESKSGVQHVKNKNFSFGVMEGYLSLKDDFIDAEVVG